MTIAQKLKLNKSPGRDIVTSRNLAYHGKHGKLPTSQFAASGLSVEECHYLEIIEENRKLASAAPMPAIAPVAAKVVVAPVAAIAPKPPIAMPSKPAVATSAVKPQPSAGGLKPPTTPSVAVAAGGADRRAIGVPEVASCFDSTRATARMPKLHTDQRPPATGVSGREFSRKLDIQYSQLLIGVASGLYPRPVYSNAQGMTFDPKAVEQCLAKMK